MQRINQPSEAGAQNLELGILQSCTGSLPMGFCPSANDDVVYSPVDRAPFNTQNMLSVPIWKWKMLEN